jgi:hypothetical protein
MFYRNVVPLSRERHKDWYIDANQGYAFTAQTNSIYIAGTEFPVASREYPIVFARDAQQQLLPVALLGLRADQNLVVDDQGTWQFSYVPAYIRRYPFILAASGGNPEQYTVCIDEGYSGFNTVKEGERLITEAGEHGELLAKSVKFLQEFHKHSEATRGFCEAIDKAGLIESMQANFSLKSGVSFSLAGFFCASREKLKGLGADELKRFAEQDYLDLLYLHIYSLSNIDKLMERYAQAEADDTATLHS